MDNYKTKILKVEDDFIQRELFGELDKNIKRIEESFSVKIYTKEDEVKIRGSKIDAELTLELMNYLKSIIYKEEKLTEQTLDYSIKLIKEGKESYIEKLLNTEVSTKVSGEKIKPMTLGQKIYVDSIDENDIVFGIGPAGTGKTYLAVAKAVKAFKNNEVSRIILTRPAIEAGESLGFLPGDLQEKVDPYLRPLYDALFDILGFGQYMKLMEKGLIEIAPLAYMRGRTLDSSYIILDEAQNTTNEQMKMFLTRLGYGSKAIVTGDITQIDLPKGKKSGLIQVQEILRDTKGIDFVYFKKEDVVRHSIVQKIIEAYENYDEIIKR